MANWPVVGLPQARTRDSPGSARKIQRARGFWRHPQGRLSPEGFFLATFLSRFDPASTPGSCIFQFTMETPPAIPREKGLKWVRKDHLCPVEHRKVCVGRGSASSGKEFPVRRREVELAVPERDSAR